MEFVTFIYVTLSCMQAFSISFSEGRSRSHQKRDTRHKSLKIILQEAKYSVVKDVLEQAPVTQSHIATRTNLRKLLDDVETLTYDRQQRSSHRRKRCVEFWCGDDRATKGAPPTTTTPPPPPFAQSSSTTVKTEATTTVSSTTVATTSSPPPTSPTATQSSSVASTSSSTATQSSSVASTSSVETQSNTSPTVTVTTDKTNGGSSVFVWSLTSVLVPLLLVSAIQ